MTSTTSVREQAVKGHAKTLTLDHWKNISYSLERGILKEQSVKKRS